MKKANIMDVENVALFDMDGTICDYEGAMLNGLRDITSPFENMAINNPPLHDKDIPDYFRERMRLIKQTPGWWKNLPTLNLGMSILLLAKFIGFKIHILTKGPKHTTSAWTEKVEWCYKNLGEDIDITITQDKGLVYGKVLVDDYPEYMDRWLQWRPRGLGIMPVNSQNKTYSHPNVIMLDDDKDTLEKIRLSLIDTFKRRPINHDKDMDGRN